MRRGLAALIAGAAVLVFATTAAGIVYGEPDGEGHPNVGALLAPEPFDDGTWTTCSGTLISPTVFLTAAHCDWGLARMAVTFDSAYDADSGKEYWGAWHADPAFRGAQGDPHDLAVVVFDRPIRGITPAQLPAADSLANLPSDQSFTSVGYGAQSVTVEKGHTFHYADVRFVATSSNLNSTNQSWLRISMNPKHGDGGTCYGDSGGPNFLGAGAAETDIVAAITVTGDTMCRSTNVVYRLDTDSARSFLGQYVRLP